MRNDQTLTVFSARGRPSDCRQADPSSVPVTSLRNQRRTVSGFAATATSANALSPSRWVTSAKVRFSPSDSCSRGLRGWFWLRWSVYEVEENVLLHAQRLPALDADQLIEDYRRLIQLTKPEFVSYPDEDLQTSRL